MRIFFTAVGSCVSLLLLGCSADSADSADSDNTANTTNTATSCSLGADEASRLRVARALVTVEANTYESLIAYWAQDAVHKESVLTNTGRQQILEYFSAMFSGSAYGFPLDRKVAIKDELYNTQADGHMTYSATTEWSGSFGSEDFLQTGMSIVKFRPDEGCAYYQRDYSTEGDTWWNIQEFKSEVNIFRNMYINIFSLDGRCFDDDGDGYAKYSASMGCTNSGLDCNDFVPGINPGAMEIPGNGIDEDCNPLTPIDTVDIQLQNYQ